MNGIMEIQLPIGSNTKIIIKKKLSKFYIILYLMVLESIEYKRIWDWNFIVNLKISIFYLFKDRKYKNNYVALQVC